MSQITIEPPSVEWLALAQANRDRRTGTLFSVRDISAFRKGVLERANHFTVCSLGGIARPTSVERLIIAAGHQPVLYHPGVLRKNLMLSKAVAAHTMSGLNVIIDTDTGEAGGFSYPVRLSPREYSVMTAGISTGGEIYLSQRIKAVDQLKPVFSTVREQVLPELLPQIDQIEHQYTEFAGQPAIFANASIRRAFEGDPTYDEILLTDLISLQLARDFYAEVITSGRQFVTVFNAELDQYRVERKIKNHANPFPNLAVSGDTVELPFWVVNRDTGTRSALLLRESDQQLLQGGQPLCAASEAAEWFNWDRKDCNIRLAPRALMITALLRLFVSDYFLHGLGGARYDAFLDRLFASFWHVEPPSFGVVSETRGLFPAQVEELDRDSELLGKSREIQFHLGQYLENGTFSPERAAVLREYWLNRQALVENLKLIKSAGGSAAEVTQQLKGIDLAIKNSLQEFFSSIKLPDDGTQRTFRFREFPYFLFARNSL